MQSRNIDLFECFAADRSLMDDPSLVLPPEVPKPVLSAEMMSKLNHRAKMLSQKLANDFDQPSDIVPLDDGSSPGATTSNEATVLASTAAVPQDLRGRMGLEDDFVESREQRERYHRRAPWINLTRVRYHSNPWLGLHEEILDYIRYVTPDNNEMAQRRRVVDEVQELCRTMWPTCAPRCFGSMSTMLILPMSDIDICVTDVPLGVQDALTSIANEVMMRKMCSEAFPRVIRSTRVPLVKFTHRDTGLSVDISVNAEEGVANTEIVREFLRVYPAAFPLCLIVKAFLQRRKLHEPYFGGLGSYGCILLVVSFLQHHPCGRDKRVARDVNLGMLLVDFFRYYGTAFQWPFVGISVTDGGRYFWKSRDDARCLLLEDPVNSTNNVGATTRNFGWICRTFELAYQILLSTGEGVKTIGIHNGQEKPVGSTDKSSRLGRIVWINEEELVARDRLHEAHKLWIESKQRHVGCQEFIEAGDESSQGKALHSKNRKVIYGDDRHLQSVRSSKTVSQDMGESLANENRVRPPYRTSPPRKSRRG